MKVNNLNQEIIDKIISIYNEVGNSHRKSPSLKEINLKFDENMEYEFVTKGFKWSSKLVFKKERDNVLIEFVINKKLPSFMLQSLELMKEKFDNEIKDIT